jgi:hypothetical protein
VFAQQRGSSSREFPTSERTKDPQAVPSIQLPRPLLCARLEVESLHGTLVPPNSTGRHGTTAPLKPQTCMNEQRKSRRLRGVSTVDASRRPRTAIRTKRPAPRRHSAEPNWTLVALDPRFPYERGLMICLGWLRLFRTIASEGIPSAKGPFTMKHNAVVLAARPTLIFVPQRERANPRPVPVNRWQTQSWRKKIIRLPKRWDTREEAR